MNLNTLKTFFTKIPLKYSLAGIGAVVVTIGIVFYFSSTSSAEDKEPIQVNPAFAEYIDAYTSGVISTESSVKIRLANPVLDDVDTDKPVEEALFEFDPEIEGEAYWMDKQTIEFRPNSKLPNGQMYHASFFLSKVIDVEEEELKTFKFSFQTMPQYFDVTVEGLRVYDDNQYDVLKLEGVLITSDEANNDAVEKILTATHDGDTKTITWKHDADNNHYFTVEKIKRKDANSNVVLSWDGEPIGVENTGEKEVMIPAKGEFVYLSNRLNQSPQQYLILTFSDPIDTKQDLEGLITISKYTSGLSFEVKGNEIRVHAPNRIDGTHEVYIDGGIKNSMGICLGKSERFEVIFEQIKPNVRLVGEGVILPSTDGLIFPFEAVNLHAVDVTVIRIYEDNIAQFMQVNDLKGERELKRVGRPVFKKRISLKAAGITQYNKWNRFTLDIAEFIKTEPGAIYQIQIGFKRAYSTYGCGDEEQTIEDNDEMASMDEENWDEMDEEESSYWDYYDEYYYEDYDWSERDNPCSNSYYGGRRTVKRNVLASNIGLIAKRGEDGKIHFAVTDLISTQPISGAKLEVFDYQQQLITSTTTDGDGFAVVETKHKPFLLVATFEKQKGYLKLDDGSSLSLSNFDVSGQKVQKGIKGYIYGERGVWRPGDTLFLTFILEDEHDRLPASHPVLFELRNPQGQLVSKMVNAKPVDGFYNFTTMTSADAPTGNWTAKVKVGGATFTKVLKIETIKPNRLKIKLDFGKEKLSAADPTIRGDLEVKWLHGAIARNLKADFEVFLTQATTSFKKYPDYTFDDPARTFYTESKKIFDGYIDNEGRATIQANISTDNDAPGMLMASFKGKVFEESGDFSVDRFKIPYYPYESFVGVRMPKGDKSRNMLLTDTNHIVDIVTVDADGKPVSSNDLSIEVYKVNWKWWWDRSNDNLSRYINGYSYSPVLEGSTTTNSKGRGTWKLRIDYPQWGRFFIRVCNNETGHCTGQTFYIDWPGWAGESQEKNPGAASMLTFETEKAKYTVGEKAKITIPNTGKGGRALVSFETGSKVVAADWVETTEGKTVYEFETTPEMSPNVYANITLVQPHSSRTKNDLPMRLYGVIPITVDDPNTHLKPVLKMPDELSPEQTVKLSVSEATGKPMTYSVAIVDEGLLDLTRFPTPDPWSHFYAREALGVKTWDLYDYVFGAYGGQLERIMAIGGDGELGDAKGDKNDVNRFKPVVIYLGPFHLDKDGKNDHSFKMPKYIGSVRTMVVAGYDEAYGSTEKTTPVREELMVLGTLPRVLGPQEKVKLPVTVFAMADHIKNAKVTVKANSMFKFNGPSTKTVSFSKPGDKVVYFDMEVVPGIGKGEVTITAQSGKKTTSYDIELEVRNPNPQVVDVIEAVIEPGQSWSKDYLPVGMAGTNEGVVELSSIPPINLEKRLKYLIRYPHGCIEQTTSSVFPQVYLDKLLKLDSKTEKEIEKNIKAGIDRLKGFQTSSGGFSYWPGEQDPNSWGSNYAGHFIVEAKKMGYNVPDNMMKDWRKFQKDRAREWRNTTGYFNTPHTRANQDLVQAYRLYTLALAGYPENGAMNRLRENGNLSLQAKWRLAAAYAVSGKKEAAMEIIDGLTTDIASYQELGNTYGSATRDKAMILETLSLLNERAKGFSIVKDISEVLGTEKWVSTQTTAYCLIGVSKYSGMDGGSETMKYSFKANGQSPVNRTSGEPIAQFDLDIKGEQGGNVMVKNTGESMLYARIILSGKPLIGDQTAAENNLKMDVVYTNMDGDPINVSNLDQGTDFIAKVTVYNPGIKGDYEEMALTQIFPSGWEIHNTRMDETGDFYNVSVPEYQDIRDDRVYTYFDLKATERKTFTVLLNATYTGRYYLPTIYCEAMYDNTINARKPGKWVDVVKPGVQ